jgi:hypothetical protein
VTLFLYTFVRKFLSDEGELQLLDENWDEDRDEVMFRISFHAYVQEPVDHSSHPDSQPSQVLSVLDASMCSFHCLCLFVCVCLFVFIFVCLFVCVNVYRNV